jgi:hypothetical protein
MNTRFNIFFFFFSFAKYNTKPTVHLSLRLINLQPFTRRPMLHDGKKIIGDWIYHTKSHFRAKSKNHACKICNYQCNGLFFRMNIQSICFLFSWLMLSSNKVKQHRSNFKSFGLSLSVQSTIVRRDSSIYLQVLKHKYLSASVKI